MSTKSVFGFCKEHSNHKIEKSKVMRGVDFFQCSRVAGRENAALIQRILSRFSSAVLFYYNHLHYFFSCPISISCSELFAILCSKTNISSCSSAE